MNQWSVLDTDRLYWHRPARDVFGYLFPAPLCRQFWICNCRNESGTAFGYLSHQSYFEEAIRSRLRDGHRFLGAIGGVRKQKLVAGARCLAVTSQVAETSSLAAMEALACGTPVVTFRVGALCELIDDGRTGYFVDTVMDLPDAIRASQKLDPVACRREAELRFSSKIMEAKYIDLYRKAAAKAVHSDNLQLCEATC